MTKDIPPNAPEPRGKAVDLRMWFGSEWEPHPGYETGNTAYCWAHGYKLRKGHTGATCKAREFGDNDDKRTATRSNTKGGSQANKGFDE